MKTPFEQLKEQLQIKIAEGLDRFPVSLNAQTSKASLAHKKDQTSFLILCEGSQKLPDGHKAIVDNLMQKLGVAQGLYRIAEPVSMATEEGPPPFSVLCQQVLHTHGSAYDHYEPQSILCFGSQARLSFALLAFAKNLWPTESVKIDLNEWLWGVPLAVPLANGSMAYAVPSLSDLVAHPAWRKSVWAVLKK